MFQNEDHYWWFVSRRELVLRLIDRLPRLGRGQATILDVGCGTGATAAALRRHGKVIGVDFSALALNCCTRRELTDLIQGHAESLPVKDGSIDAIVATDILEHLDDDRMALAEFHRVLKPNGYAVITVPAYNFLWSEHDLALMHKRRYVARELLDRSIDSGFRVISSSYALFFLFPLSLGRLFKRARPEGRTPQAQLQPVPPWLNTLLIHLQRFEAALTRGISLPWGLSVVAVLQKS
jgi:SAM-dependent methyltransferase